MGWIYLNIVFRKKTNFLIANFFRTLLSIKIEKLKY
jgi:hypothetical protein